MGAQMGTSAFFRWSNGQETDRCFGQKRAETFPSRSSVDPHKTSADVKVVRPTGPSQRFEWEQKEMLLSVMTGRPNVSMIICYKSVFLERQFWENLKRVNTEWYSPTAGSGKRKLSGIGSLLYSALKNNNELVIDCQWEIPNHHFCSCIPCSRKSN